MKVQLQVRSMAVRGKKNHTLTSLCKSSAECMYFSALKSWYMMYCLWMSSKIFARITASQKSQSVLNNTWIHHLHASQFPCTQKSDRCLCRFLLSEHSTTCKDGVCVHSGTEVLRNSRNLRKPDNILVVVDLLQKHNFAKRSLCICSVLERVKDFFHGYNITGLLVHRFPNYSVCLVFTNSVLERGNKVQRNSVPLSRASAVFRIFAERACRSLRSSQMKKHFRLPNRPSNGVNEGIPEKRPGLLAAIRGSGRLLLVKRSVVFENVWCRVSQAMYSIYLRFVWTISITAIYMRTNNIY